MTVRTNSVQTCDRCEKPFNEKHLKAADVVPTFKQRGLVVTETKGTNKDAEPKFTVLVSFDDMCPDCQKAVDNLVAKLRLDGKKKRGPAKKRGAKTPEEKKPSTDEYTEDPPPAEAKDDDSEKEPEKAPAPPDPDAPTNEETDPAPEAEAEASAEEEPAAEATEPEEPELASEPGETSDGGNGAEATSETTDDSNLVEDPTTGDKYDPDTGEVVVKGQNGEQEKHPF